MKVLIFIILAIIQTSVIAQRDSLILERKSYTKDSMLVLKSYYKLSDKDSVFRYQIYRRGYLNKITYVQNLEKNPKYIGRYQEFYSNGDLKTTGFYNNNGLPSKKWTRYYENKKLKSETFVENGLFNGIIITYYENAQIKELGDYTILNRNGVFIDLKRGVWTGYYENSNKKYKGCYFSEELIEFSKEKYKQYEQEMGFIVKPMYEQEIKHRKWKYYNEDGTLTKVEIYDKGKLIETKTY